MESVLVAWFITFLVRGRSQLAITSQMIYARLAMNGCRISTRNPARQRLGVLALAFCLVMDVYINLGMGPTYPANCS